MYLNDAGIDSIPAVGFVDEVDARVVGNWLADFRLQSIFVDLQSADSNASWELVRSSLPAFMTRAQSIERIYVNGVAQPARVIELAQLTGPLEFILTNRPANHLSASERDFYFDGKQYINRRTAARSSRMFNHLVSFYGDATGRRICHYLPCSDQRRLL